MTEGIGFNRAVRASHELAASALPNAPVVDYVEDEPRVRSARRWTAARLRVVARSTYHLANRVDPVCLPGR